MHLKKTTIFQLDLRRNRRQFADRRTFILSGVERSLAGSKFHMRVDECRSAAYAFKAFLSLEYGKFEEANLRDVPFEIFEKYKSKLPENWAKRAEHFLYRV